MKITVQINTCGDCRHLTHCGSYLSSKDREILNGHCGTICGHTDATGSLTSIERRALKDEKYHWKYRLVDKSTVPEWCPLSLGCPY